MNIRAVDGWTLLHFITIFIVSLWLLSMGIGILLVAITTFFIVSIYEILEHSMIGDMVFGWFEKKRKEIFINSVVDVLVGLFAMIIAVMIYTK